MSKKVSKRQKRVDKIMDFLRTYNAFIDNYGGCVKSIDLMNGCNRELAVTGSLLMQDIVRAYNHYNGGQLDGLYRKVCRNSDKRGVYQRVLLTDWKKAIKSFYSCALSIPGLTERQAIDAIKDTYKLVK